MITERSTYLGKGCIKKEKERENNNTASNHSRE
jgi:hypothetical protein